jgi:hypothetical protein
MPLRRRPFDWVFIAFLALNATFITYIVDIEQLIIADPSNFSYPAWPPAPFVDLIHWWGNTYDPLLMARPPFWQMTIWIDVIFFGPFYFLALYAFIKGRNWIRVPALVWSGMMLSNVLILMFEEAFGEHPPPQPAIVFLANLSWFVFPLLMIWRMRREPFPHEA